MGVRIFQLRMAKRVGEQLHTCSAFSTGCRHFKKDLWHSETGRKQADTLIMAESRHDAPKYSVLSANQIAYNQFLPTLLPKRYN